MMSFQTALQRFGLSKIVIYVYFYGPIKKKMLCLFPSKFSLKKAFVMIAFDMMNISEEYTKNENFDLGSYFCL